jgi:hypothetical protein
MPNMTLSIPEDLHAVIRKHPEVSWSAVAREAMWEYARKMQLLDTLTAASNLTDADVDELAKQIKKAVRRRDDEAQA